MSKDSVLADFETNLTDPGAQKSGEYLREHILQTARLALNRGDRIELIEVFRGWLNECSEPKTMLAVHVAKELRLFELRADLEKLRVAIKENRVFLPFYARWVDLALTALQ